MAFSRSPRQSFSRLPRFPTPRVLYYSSLSRTALEIIGTSRAHLQVLKGHLGDPEETVLLKAILRKYVFCGPILGKPVPCDVYRRLADLEEKVLHLEGISPEYFTHNVSHY